ncbi:MAG TPA: hypothetical protein VNL18_16670 [Gemmatimonadales bacterium]|nr:hypothetical protein [Gemmatimonadales bacterium]
MRTRFLALILALPAIPAAGQAPPSADLWRLSASSLSGPASLERGPAAAFWNPAAPDLSRRFSVGAELTQTPDVIGVAGFVGAVHYRLRPGLAATALVARVDLDDIVRTTTSATSDLGTIPIYAQLVGVGVVVAAGSMQAGALVRGHDARFDALRESGVTVDAGARIALHKRLTVAGATHFLPVNLKSRDLTDYYLGADFLVTSRRMFGGITHFHLRYGATHREATGTDHGVGLGLRFNDDLGVEVSVVREDGIVESAMRPVVGLALRVGRYLIRAGRAAGLNDIGASYRIGLESDILR